MEESKQKKNWFLSLLGSAAKSLTACLIALFLINLFEEVSSKKKVATKQKLLKLPKRSASSVEDKIEKWR